MGVGAERPKTWGGSSQKLGRIDRVWGGSGADRPGADRLWGGSTGTPCVGQHCHSLALRRRSATDKLLCNIEAHPNWPLYVDVFDQPQKTTCSLTSSTP